MLWWYSSKGLLNQDDALRANITSRLTIQDNPMFATKANMSFNLSGVCSSQYENMLLCSVPYGDKMNRRTMVLDQAPVGPQESQTNAWASYWTGWRPIEWARGVVNGEARVFFGSVDYDGRNRIWEIGTQTKTDNGVPITCNLITREHLFESRDEKMLNFVDAELCNIKDDVSFMISAAGVRGGWQVIGEKEIVSSQGQVYGDALYGEGAEEFAGTSPQTRIVKSQNYVSPNECNAICVESDSNSGLIDRAFSIMFSWSGILGINAYRVFAKYHVNINNGECSPNEEGVRMLNSDGCGSLDRFDTDSPFTEYASTRTFSQVNPQTSLVVSYQATATSIISQQDADRKAYLSARSYVESQIG